MIVLERFDGKQAFRVKIRTFRYDPPKRRLDVGVKDFEGKRFSRGDWQELPIRDSLSGKALVDWWVARYAKSGYVRVDKTRVAEQETAETPGPKQETKRGNSEDSCCPICGRAKRGKRRQDPNAACSLCELHKSIGYLPKDINKKGRGRGRPAMFRCSCGVTGAMLGRKPDGTFLCKNCARSGRIEDIRIKKD